MSWETIITIILGLISLLSAPYIYIWRTTVLRVDNLEKELKNKATKEDIKEKLQPISDDIKEIQQRIDRILSHLLNDK